MNTTNPLAIGSIALGEIPRVVAVIDEFLDMHRIAALAKTGADILEMRFDLLGDDIPSLCVYVDKIKKTTNFPCIGTIRETDGNRHKRMDMFKSVIPFVDAVDIEIDASIAQQVIAHAAGKTVIVSEHDFEKTPDIAHLHAIADRAHEPRRPHCKDRGNGAQPSRCGAAARVRVRMRMAGGGDRHGRFRHHLARPGAGVRVAVHVRVFKIGGRARPDSGW